MQGNHLKQSRFLSVLVFMVSIMVLMITVADTSKNYETLDWTDLLPAADLEALRNPPSYLDEIQDGSPEDAIGRGADSMNNSDGLFATESSDSFGSESEFAYQQALTSTRIVGELNGRPIRIPGFIVPLEYDDELVITEFFLVPYFGACIHLPPPPPNQMILVDYPKGIQMDALYTPIWVSGELKAEVTKNELGTSAYAMRMDVFESYDE